MQDADGRMPVCAVFRSTELIRIRHRGASAGNECCLASAAARANLSGPEAAQPDTTCPRLPGGGGPHIQHGASLVSGFPTGEDKGDARQVEPTVGQMIEAPGLAESGRRANIEHAVVGAIGAVAGDSAHTCEPASVIVAWLALRDIADLQNFEDSCDTSVMQFAMGRWWPHRSCLV